MTVPGSTSTAFEKVLLTALGAVLAGSVILLFAGHQPRPQAAAAFEQITVEPADTAALEQALRLAGRGAGPAAVEHDLFVGELRVVAIGSAYPIPYEAEICPFSGLPQPSMDQLDRDGDGLTDDWELQYGLDRYNAGDAAADSDGDGFSNLDEFSGGTNPLDAKNHPSYAEKLRFVERKDRPFPLVFQGFMEQSDGKIIFQLNNPKTGKTHFLAVGERAEGVEVKRFELNEDGRHHRLFVARRGHEVELVRGEAALDPESEAELINILDQTSVMVTMGALLSLHNDEYIVLSVHPDKVILRDTASGKVYDIVGLADGEPEGFPEG